jgi:DNA-directed RNA polymerase subunit RPC12/RpoP
MIEKRDAYTCESCGVAYAVLSDEEEGAAAAAAVDVECPHCGRKRTVWVPRGVEDDLVVEPVLDEADAEAEEGAGD